MSAEKIRCAALDTGMDIGERENGNGTAGGIEVDGESITIGAGYGVVAQTQTRAVAAGVVTAGAQCKFQSHRWIPADTAGGFAGKEQGNAANDAVAILNQV